MQDLYTDGKIEECICESISISYHVILSAFRKLIVLNSLRAIVYISLSFVL